MTSEIQVVWAGRQEYVPTWELQRELVLARRRGLIGDLLLLVEHPPTYTIGRGGSRDNLLISEAQLEAVCAQCLDVDRGGDITFHGPGQLVAYLIRDLGGAQRRLRHYVSQLEETVIRTVAHYGLQAAADPRYPGVWIGRDKIAALGIAVSRGVSYHGFALNVDPDLRYFGYMIPCGISGRGATSIARELGRPVPLEPAIEPLVVSFAESFEAEMREGLTVADLQAIAETVRESRLADVASGRSLGVAG